MKIVLAIFITLIASLFIISSCNRGSNENPDPPVAHFTYTSLRNLPATVHFTNTSTTPGGTATYAWDFGDGSQLGGSTNAIHTYPQAGTYQVRLIQTPTAGAADTVVKVLQISITGPSGVSNRSNNIHSADFTMSIAYASYTATFINTSSGATSYLWDFNDGSTSTSASSTIIHSFTSPGTYHVVLAATNNNGVDTCGATITF